MVQPIDEKSVRYRIIKSMFDDKFQGAEESLSKYTASGTTGIASSCGEYHNHTNILIKFKITNSDFEVVFTYSCIGDNDTNNNSFNFGEQFLLSDTYRPSWMEES